MLSHGVERNATPVFLPGRLIRLSAFSVMLYRGGYQSDVSAAVVAMVVCTYSCLFLNNNKANTPTGNTRSERPLSA
jgi:hypothetical protein